MKEKYNFRFLIVLILLAAAVFAPAQTRPNSKYSKEKTKRKEKNKTEAVTVVEKMFAAFNRRDADALSALYADQTFVDAPDFPKPKTTPAEVAAHYREMFQQSPDIRDEVKTIFADGNRVFVEFVSLGTMQNPSPKMPESVKGKKFLLKIASFLEVENGRIVRDITYYDQLSVLQQIGLMPE